MNKRLFPSLIVAVSSIYAAVLICCTTALAQEPTQKIKITKLDELPKHTYPFTGKVSELVKDKAGIAKLCASVRADIEADLDKYEIKDATTLQRRYGTLMTIDLLAGDYDAAIARLEQIRKLEDKEAKQLTTGLTSLALIDAKRETGDTGHTPAYRQAFQRNLTRRVQALPWETVQDVIEDSKGRMEIFSENLLLGLAQNQMDPVVEKNGELSDEMAARAITFHFILTERLALKQEIISVYGDMIAANKSIKPDIWAARRATLAAGDKLTPVLMAVWDSGADPEIFKDRLFVNRYEKPDGKDTDGNGYVDDIHGVAYDIHARRTTGWLCPLGDDAGRIGQIMQHTKGLMDLQAAVDSPEATALKQHLSSLDPADVGSFIEDLGLAGDYCHGTHVAGIMVEGNPFAKLLIARHSYDHHIIPVVRDIEWGKRDAAKCRDIVGYLKEHGVRVVNMSWGEALGDIEDSLEKNGIGDSAEQRRETARKVYALQKDGLYEAIKNAPDILFVCAAGNADNDVEFDDDIPSSFDLPNLLVVGAVDQAGDPTDFTSFGQTVGVCAAGFEVDSYVPGGGRMKFSGTSMASPDVANLAGKLLAMEPNLTPQQVISLIQKGAERRTDGAATYLLMNPKRTVELLASKTKTQTKTDAPRRRAVGAG